PGIVYNVARFIFERGGNIIHAQQHKEEIDNRFFMRVKFDCSDMNVTKSQFQKELAELAEQFRMETSISFGDDRKRMAIMVSKYDHCLYDLFLKHKYGEINADICLIVSNHPDLEPVAENFSIPFFYIPVTPGTKAQAEKQTLELFEHHYIHFVVLARYMQILSSDFVQKYRNNIINVHHSFLPAFVGAKPYHQAYERGVKLIGATSHYVTEDLDEGPIIYQECIHVNHTHSVEDLIAMGRDIEKKVLSEAVKAHADDRIMVYRRRTIIFD
ncbi:MAG: formyltetrahydrofolate deformylase, partial [Candidatus Hydrogenedens sp.]